MRTAPSSIDTMLDGTILTLSRCVKMRLRDGFEFGFTDHDRDLTVALDNDFYEPLTYLAGHGLIVGDIDLAVGLESSNTEAKLPISELITREAVLARRFHGAKAFVFDVDWTQDTPQPLEIMAGHIAEPRIERNVAVFEVRDQADFWNVTIGRLLSPRCSADFGDGQCGATVTNHSATVSETLSNMRFKLNFGGPSFADDHFRFGEVEFLSGDLASTWPYEVVRYEGSTGEVEVLSPMPGFAGVGNSALIRIGCSKLKSSDDPSLPTCLTHQNVGRFRGFDRVPGTDRFVRFPIPGMGQEQ